MKDRKKKGGTNSSKQHNKETHIPSVYTLSIRFRLTAGRLEHA